VSGSRTPRQLAGATAEADAADHLRGLGWQIVAQNVHVARDEIDIVAVDPGPPATLVLVEVRSLRSSQFGLPEERVDRAKVARLYRALSALRLVRELPDGVAIPRLARRVDLLIVDRRMGGAEIRHLRALEPP
jgi:putative endonuclease